MSDPLLPLPLAVFYGWPSLVNGSRGDVVRAADDFARFEVAILGDDMPTPAGDPRGPAVAEALAGRCRLYGYLSVGWGRGQPCWSEPEIGRRLGAWAAWGVEGVLLDCAGRDFGVSPTRLARACAAARDWSLRIAINAWDPDDVAAAGAALWPGDAVLAENDVLRHGAFRPRRTYRDRLGRLERVRGDLEVALWAIGTTSERAALQSYGATLAAAVVRSWHAAGAWRPTLLAIADPLYGASDNRLPLPLPLPRPAASCPGDLRGSIDQPLARVRAGLLGAAHGRH